MKEDEKLRLQQDAERIEKELKVCVGPDDDPRKCFKCRHNESYGHCIDHLMEEAEDIIGKLRKEILG